jgi:hypothetical protein
LHDDTPNHFFKGIALIRLKMGGIVARMWRGIFGRHC